MFLSVAALFASLASLALLLVLHSLQNRFHLTQTFRAAALDQVQYLSADETKRGMLVETISSWIGYLTDVRLPLDSGIIDTLADNLLRMKLDEARASARCLQHALGLLLFAVVAITGAGFAGPFVIFAGNTHFALGCVGCAAVFVIVFVLLSAYVGFDLMGDLVSQGNYWDDKTLRH